MVSLLDEGIDVGEDEGFEVGKEEGFDIGKDEGFDVGKDEGCDVGADEGGTVGVAVGGEEVLEQLVESCEEYGALTGQARHTMLDEAPVVLEYVPGGHLLQV